MNNNIPSIIGLNEINSGQLLAFSAVELKKNPTLSHQGNVPIYI